MEAQNTPNLEINDKIVTPNSNEENVVENVTSVNPVEETINSNTEAQSATTTEDVVETSNENSETKENQNTQDLESNLLKKKEILDKLEEYLGTSDDLSKTVPQCKELIREWKNIGDIPEQYVQEVNNKYNKLLDTFRGFNKTYFDMREYDFQKNLALKKEIIEKAKKLLEQDITSAVKDLQKLHAEWKETGSVAPALRDEIWEEFRQLSSQINQKYQAYYEELKEKEKEYAELRNNACMLVESIDFTTLKTFKEWNEKTEEVIATNVYFKKTDNPVEARVINKYFKRYRTACDKFFEAKKIFQKEQKSILQGNLETKQAILNKAKELKNSTDWNATTNALIELQKEWNAAGPAPRKINDTLHAQFREICDYFFEKKSEAYKDRIEVEQENLKSKLELIDKIKNFEFTGNDDEDFSALKFLCDQYQSIKTIPYKERENLYKKYKQITDEQFSKIRMKRKAAQMSFEGNINKLRNQYDIVKQKLITYENNIGFFMKGGKNNSIINELERKIADLREELTVLQNQINSLNESNSNKEE